MKKNEQTTSEISKFFLPEDAQSDLADFLVCTADEIEDAVSPLKGIDLNDFDNLDDEERESAICGLWFAANITADEVYRLLDECEQVVTDYHSLSEALLRWHGGEANPLADPNITSSFRWHKRQLKEGIIYELRHKDITLLSNYLIEELFPHFGEAHFTKEALDYITESITD